MSLMSFQDGDIKNETDKMYRSILSNITDSESNYVEWLSVLLKVMDCCTRDIEDMNLTFIFSF